MKRLALILALMVALGGVCIRLAQSRMGLDDVPCFCDSCVVKNYPADAGIDYGAEAR